MIFGVVSTAIMVILLPETCTSHFIEKGEEAADGRPDRKQELICRTREARLVDHGSHSPDNLSSVSHASTRTYLGLDRHLYLYSIQFALCT